MTPAPSSRPCRAFEHSALATGLSVLLLGSSALHAAGPHDHAHSHKPLHGGVVVEAKDIDYELVATAQRVQLYLRDHGKPMDVSKATGHLTLLSGTDKQEIALKPVGNRLEASGAFKMAPGSKAVARVTAPGFTGVARFVLP